MNVAGKAELKDSNYPYLEIFPKLSATLKNKS